MNFMNMMNNMQNVKAKQEMRANPWGKRLDDVLTKFEELIGSADEDQLTQLIKVADVIQRIATNNENNVDWKEGTDDWWEDKLEAAMTEIRALAEAADEKQLPQIERSGGEIKRVVLIQLSYWLDEDDDEDEDNEHFEYGR